MNLKKIRNARIVLKHKTQAAFPPYYLKVQKRVIPGFGGTYFYTEMILTHGLPYDFRGIHGHAMINATFNYFKNVNAIIIPSYDKLNPIYTITRSEWQSFEFLTSNFEKRYACAKFY